MSPDWVQVLPSTDSQLRDLKLQLPHAVKGDKKKCFVELLGGLYGIYLLRAWHNVEDQQMAVCINNTNMEIGKKKKRQVEAKIGTLFQIL